MNLPALKFSIFLPFLLAANLPAADSKTLDYTIIVTGEELLRGAFPDAHTVFITRTLHALGCHCIGSVVVDDKADDIKEALRSASHRAPLIIVTGGLGPTVNDITRGVLSEFTGIELREQPEVLAAMERRLKLPRDQIRPNLRRQTLVPTRGTYLKAVGGTAVGLVFEWNDKVIVALPGPPRELQPMVKNELAPYLRNKFGVRAPGSSITLRFVGIGQSLIDQTMSLHVPLPPDVIVGSQFEGSRVDFTFMLPSNGPEQENRLKQLAAKIREHLGEYVYADDGSSLEEQVARSLLARGAKLALVEIGTGGRLAASLAGVAETPKLLKGAFVAPSQDAMRQLLKVTDTPKDEQDLLKALARGTGGSCTIVTGAITADGSGARSCQVLIALAGGNSEFFRLGISSSETAYASAVTQIWDRLRRALK